MPFVTNITTTAPAEHTTPALEQHLHVLASTTDENEPGAGTIVAGVTVGVVACVLFLVLGWYLLRTRKQQASWDYAPPGEPDDVTDNMKPYIITPYIVPATTPYSHPGTPDAGTISPSHTLEDELELDIATLSYDAASPISRSAQTHEPDARSDIAMCGLDDRTRSPLLRSTNNRVTSSSIVLSRMASPTPSVVLEPTRASLEGSCPAPPAGSLTVGIASVAGGLKEKAKKKRKSKIRSVPRPLSFCIDKSRTGHSPLVEVPPLPPTSSLSVTRGSDVWSVD
ncbi:hypothetical protein DAEQUDRAFT_765381 [Daedalea quercina L-15889]|uniref:Uncharacterized protein n=1 Tax=Daedalea quercina L-15889 TaxID=1314783 RepID=A0A165QJ38_9APHY|nr:hypothetical protein DAEQUDRAFT_765381 [Daedalea quercina L-15889]